MRQIPVPGTNVRGTRVSYRVMALLSEPSESVSTMTWSGLASLEPS